MTLEISFDVWRKDEDGGVFPLVAAVRDVSDE
jgi:hypothetical protein